MTETADRFATAAAGFTQRVNAVPADAWNNPSPCPGWTARDAILAALADPAVSAFEFDSAAGKMNVEQSIGMIVTGDVLIHSWDLARAAGLDETLDPEEVHRMYEGAQPFDEILRSSGQFGPRVIVPDTADEQTKLIAFMGRQP